MGLKFKRSSSTSEAAEPSACVQRLCLVVLLAAVSYSVWGNEICKATCEQMVSPIGITNQHPRFSWQVKSPKRGYLQQAYQIMWAKSEAGLKAGKDLVWDSGKVESGESVLVTYQGPELQPSTTYYWKVRTWSSDGTVSKWSEPQRFTTGLPSEADWQGASWIALEEDRKKVVPGLHTMGGAASVLKDEAIGDYAQPQFRKCFTLDKKRVLRATAFVCGLGHFDLFLNGRKVGDHLLDAGWTLYSREALYVGFDVTDCLQKGENVIGIMLGNGFYNVPYDRERYFKLLTTFGAPKMRFLMQLEYADGQREYVVSDKTWRASRSPITFSSIYGGEDYDARLEEKGWKSQGYDDSGWAAAKTVQCDVSLKPQLCEPVTVRSEIPTLRRFRNQKGQWVYDLGQNSSAIVRIKLRSKGSSRVVLRPAELLNPDSTVNQSASGSPYYFSYTTPDEPGIVVWQPQFTYYGFRYVQVEGAVPAGEEQGEAQPQIEEMTGLHLCNAASEAGTFHCDYELFNQIHELIDWAIRSNMVSVLTDCPHREKLGWLEQAHLMQPSVEYRYDVSALYPKMFNDMSVSQREDGCIPSITPEYTRFQGGFEDSPEWGSSFIISAWQHYRTYGDEAPIILFYNGMKRYAEYLFSRADNGIVDYGLGDWFDIGPGSPGMAQLTSKALTATAYLYMDLRMMKQIAHLLGKGQDEARFALQAATIRNAFRQKFIDPQTLKVENGSQTACALTLWAGLLNKAEEKAVLSQLVADIEGRGNALTAGDIGYRYVLASLAGRGRSDVVFSMNSRSDVPGYGWQLAHGATALTESWQAYGFVSNNHFMLGHLMEWLYAWLGGIRQTEKSVAFREILFDPQPVGNVNEADTRYATPYGTACCHWKRQGPKMHLQLSVPENSTALLALPSADRSLIRLDNAPLPSSAEILEDAGSSFLRLGSGTYEVEYSTRGQEPMRSQTVSGKSTIVKISGLEQRADVSPMIYGQMLEDCNDNVIYGGIVNKGGEENIAVTEQLKKLQIPVVRWPAGTAIYDYEWKRGVGPSRTAQSEKIWGGVEYYTFGTDEYVSWCRKIGAEPYINIPMGNNNTFAHSLDEALEWVEYVNGAPDSPMGADRARNGHEEPYGVKCWCLGNENYLENPFHKSENASVYAEELHTYASALKHHFPEISLLGVGHTGDWNKTVLGKCGEDIDFLTLHFYLNASINNKVLETPMVTLFAPEKVEANIRRFSKELDAYNKSVGRLSHPIRFSIDEWNCRHSVYNGNGYSFTRKDARRLYDVAAMASMLNVFIRTSPFVGMANYIFPVNGHGLLKTVGEQDAYQSACYHVFSLYRHLMTGKAVEVEVTGPGLKDVNLSELNVAGDVDSALKNVRKDFCFIDCAAMVDEADRLVVSLVNRSYDTKQKVRIAAPPGYEAVEAWAIEHDDVRAENTADKRDNVTPSRITVKANSLALLPCTVAIVVMKRTKR